MTVFESMKPEKKCGPKVQTSIFNLLFLGLTIIPTGPVCSLSLLDPPTLEFGPINRPLPYVHNSVRLPVGHAVRPSVCIFSAFSPKRL